MWIKQPDYVKLIDGRARAETRADWLMQRVNQLERELATLRHDTTGKPQVIPIYTKEASTTGQKARDAELDFEDLGDEQARLHGVNWTDDGRVVLATA